jgi:hypothetical protein
VKWQSFGNNGKKRTRWKRRWEDSPSGRDAILSIGRSGKNERRLRFGAASSMFPDLDDFDNCGDYDKPVASLNTYFFFMERNVRAPAAPALLAAFLKLRIWSAFAVRVFDWPMAPVSTGLVVSFFSAGLLLINDFV